MFSSSILKIENQKEEKSKIQSSNFDIIIMFDET